MRQRDSCFILPACRQGGGHLIRANAAWHLPVETGSWIEIDLQNAHQIRAANNKPDLQSTQNAGPYPKILDTRLFWALQRPRRIVTVPSMGLHFRGRWCRGRILLPPLRGSAYVESSHMPSSLMSGFSTLQAAYILQVRSESYVSRFCSTNPRGSGLGC